MDEDVFGIDPAYPIEPEADSARFHGQEAAI